MLIFEQNFLTLCDYENKQNCRIWESQNPQVTIWCPVVLLVLSFLKTLKDYFLSEIEDYNLEDMWFQQDGPTSNTTLANRALLHDKFPGRVISRLSDVNWPARSCDLISLGLCLDPCESSCWPTESQHSLCDCRDIAGKLPKINRK